VHFIKSTVELPATIITASDMPSDFHRPIQFPHPVAGGFVSVPPNETALGSAHRLLRISLSR
jgi:hypothetical protein